MKGRALAIFVGSAMAVVAVGWFVYASLGDPAPTNVPSIDVQASPSLASGQGSKQDPGEGSGREEVRQGPAERAGDGPRTGPPGGSGGSGGAGADGPTEAQPAPPPAPTPAGGGGDDGDESDDDEGGRGDDASEEK
jgi:hypothetical protein